MSQTYVTKTKTLRTIQCSGFKVVTIMNMTKVLNPAALTMTMIENPELHLAPKQTFFCHFLPGVHFWTSHWTIPFRTSEADNFDNPWKCFFDLKLCLKLCLVEEFGKEVFWDKNLEFLYNVHISKVTTTFLIVSPPSSILMSFSLIDTGACYTNTK